MIANSRFQSIVDSMPKQALHKNLSVLIVCAGWLSASPVLGQIDIPTSLVGLRGNADDPATD
jgi:hypothetical protein